MKITMQTETDIITLHTDRVQIDELAEYVRGLFMALGYNEQCVREAMDPEWVLEQFKMELDADDS